MTAGQLLQRIEMLLLNFSADGSSLCYLVELPANDGQPNWTFKWADLAEKDGEFSRELIKLQAENPTVDWKGVEAVRALYRSLR